MKAWASGSKHLICQSLLKHFISCQICPAPSVLIRRMSCVPKPSIFKAPSGRAAPLDSWDAWNNGIVSDKVLRVAWPFLPLHKRKLKCVQLCMMPLQGFMFTLIIAGKGVTIAPNVRLCFSAKTYTNVWTTQFWGKTQNSLRDTHKKKKPRNIQLPWEYWRF